MARSSVEFFAVLKSFETTTPATPCFPSLLFRRLKMGFFTEETLRMSFFLGTTRMLLPCSFVAPRLGVTAFFRVILRSEGRKRRWGGNTNSEQRKQCCGDTPNTLRARSARAPFKKRGGNDGQRNLSLPLTCASSSPQYAPLEEPRYRLVSRKREERGQVKSARKTTLSS